MIYLRQPEVVEKFVSLGVEPRSSTPEEFAEVIRNDNARWRKVISEAGIRGD
jgi:tripartite-type tricarboxylate transporter receptor subunit TctC